MPQGSANGRDSCHCRVDWTKRLASKPARAAERSRVRIVAGAFHCRFVLCFIVKFVYTNSVKSVSRPDQYWLRYSCFALRLEAQRLERGLCRSFTFELGRRVQQLEHKHSDIESTNTFGSSSVTGEHRILDGTLVIDN